jgi:hypothetical protein
MLQPVLRIRDILVRIRTDSDTAWDPAPDHAIVVSDLQDGNLTLLFCLLPYCLKRHFHHFSKIKSHKEDTNSSNQGFSYYFCLLIEGSGSVPCTTDPDPGGPKTYGSNGSGPATLVTTL